MNANWEDEYFDLDARTAEYIKTRHEAEDEEKMVVQRRHELETFRARYDRERALFEGLAGVQALDPQRVKVMADLDLELQHRQEDMERAVTRARLSKDHASSLWGCVLIAAEKRAARERAAARDAEAQSEADASSEEGSTADGAPTASG